MDKVPLKTPQTGSKNWAARKSCNNSPAQSGANIDHTRESNLPQHENTVQDYEAGGDIAPSEVSSQADSLGIPDIRVVSSEGDEVDMDGGFDWTEEAAITEGTGDIQPAPSSAGHANHADGMSADPRIEAERAVDNDNTAEDGGAQETQLTDRTDFETDDQEMRDEDSKMLRRALDKEIQQHKAEVMGLERALQTAETLGETSLRQAREKFEDQLYDKNEKNNELEARIAQLENELDKIKQDPLAGHQHGAHETPADESEEIARLRQDIQKHQENSDNHMKEYSRWQSQRQKLEAQVRRLQHELGKQTEQPSRSKRPTTEEFRISGDVLENVIAEAKHIAAQEGSSKTFEDEEEILRLFRATEISMAQAEADEDMKARNKRPADPSIDEFYDVTQLRRENTKLSRANENLEEKVKNLKQELDISKGKRSGTYSEAGSAESLNFDSAEEFLKHHERLFDPTSRLFKIIQAMAKFYDGHGEEPSAADFAELELVRDYFHEKAELPRDGDGDGEYDLDALREFEEHWSAEAEVHGWGAVMGFHLSAMHTVAEVRAGEGDSHVVPLEKLKSYHRQVRERVKDDRARKTDEIVLEIEAFAGETARGDGLSKLAD